MFPLEGIRYGYIGNFKPKGVSEYLNPSNTPPWWMVPWQTPERQTPEIMKFFSEWNMIKFINFRGQNPQIS